MNEKELDVKLAEFNLSHSNLRVREAFVELQEGTKAINAKAARQIESLKVCYEMALIDLKEAELHLRDAKDKREQNFE